MSRDDEYHFSEEMNISDDDDSSSTATRGRYGNNLRVAGGEGLTRKNVLLGLGVVLAAFIAYKLVGVFWQAHRNSSKQQVAGSKHVLPQPAPSANKAPIVVKKEESKASDTDVIPSAMNHSQALADKFARLNSDNQASMQEMNNKFSQVQNNLNNLREDSLKTAQLLQSIQAQLDAQQTALVQLIKANTKPKKKPKKKVAKAPAMYFVKAVVPGRAWLQRKRDGKTVTLGYGDQLDAYGWVQRIDLGRGLVMMSSGKIFSFAPDDR